MIRHGIDQESQARKCSRAAAQQGEAARKAVSEATLETLLGLELTLANFQQVPDTAARAADAKGIRWTP